MLGEPQALEREETPAGHLRSPSLTPGHRASLTGGRWEARAEEKGLWRNQEGEQKRL